jgi:hypothetical protein
MEKLKVDFFIGDAMLGYWDKLLDRVQFGDTNARLFISIKQVSKFSKVLYLSISKN